MFQYRSSSLLLLSCNRITTQSVRWHNNCEIIILTIFQHCLHEDFSCYNTKESFQWLGQHSPWIRRGHIYKKISLLYVCKDIIIKTHLLCIPHPKYTHKEGSAVDDTHTDISRKSGDMPGNNDIISYSSHHHGMHMLIDR